MAWSSFATGVNPGKHNIYDFLVRDFETYMPDLAMVKKEPPEFLWGLIPTKPPKLDLDARRHLVLGARRARRHQERRADRARDVPARGDRSTARCSAGLPLPDIRGTLGTFYYWATDLSLLRGGQHRVRRLPEAAAVRRRRGRDVAARPREPDPQAGGGASCARRRSRGPLSEKEQARLDELATGKDVNLPDDGALDARAREQADIEIQGQKLTLKAGEWSDWVPLTFKVNFLVSVHGMTQFYVVRGGPRAAALRARR